MRTADLLIIESHDGHRDEFRNVTYQLDARWVRVHGSDGAELLVMAQFHVAHLWAGKVHR